MTTKTQNIMVLAIMSVVILSTVGYVVVDAERTSANKLPNNSVVERTFENWSDQYENAEKFDSTTRETVEYLTMDMEDGWQSDVRDAALKSYNLESMIGKRGAVDELVSLLSSREQVLGTHTTSEAESKYHAWMQTQFDNPKTLDEIDNRINEIIGDIDYKLVIEAYEARNFQASLGAVPEQLIRSDAPFWVKQMTLAGCSYMEGCDVDEFRKTLNFDKEILDNTPEEVRKRIENNDAGLMDYFLPKAYAAWDETFHYASMYILADSCDGSPCHFYVSTNGIGLLTPNASSGGTHTTDTTIYSVGVSWGGNTGDYHNVIMQMTDPAPTNTLAAGGYDSVWKDGILTKSVSEVTYKATNTSNAFDP